MNALVKTGLPITLIGALMTVWSFMMTPGNDATGVFIFGVLIALVGVVCLIAGVAVNAARKK